MNELELLQQKLDRGETLTPLEQEAFARLQDGNKDGRMFAGLYPATKENSPELPGLFSFTQGDIFSDPPQNAETTSSIGDVVVKNSNFSTSKTGLDDGSQDIFIPGQEKPTTIIPEAQASNTAKPTEPNFATRKLGVEGAPTEAEMATVATTPETEAKKGVDQTVIEPLTPSVQKQRDEFKTEAEYQAYLDTFRKTEELERRGNGNDLFPFIYAGGSDIETELYSLGRSLGQKRGTPGRGMSIVGSAGAATFGAARTLSAGLGFSKRNNFIEEEQRRKELERRYTNNSQYANQNNIGETSQEEGGMPIEPDQQPKQEGANQEVVQAVIEMMNQNVSPEKIVQLLVQKGVDQAEAISIVKAILQGGQPQEEMQETAPQEQQEEMEQGGFFGKGPGDYVSFEYEGKRVSGKIAKIENGEIFLA